LICRKCGTPYHFKKPRNWFGRNVLFFLPLKRFFCAKCLENRYRFITDKQLEDYHKV
jgi:hypothetical protein